MTPEQRLALETDAASQRSRVLLWLVIVLSVIGYLIFFFWQVGGDDGLLFWPSILPMALLMLGVLLLVWFLSLVRRSKTETWILLLAKWSG